MSDAQTRRDVLRGASIVVVAATLPVAVLATTAAPPDRWADLEAGFVKWEPAVIAALRHAQAAGVDPWDLSCVSFPNRSTAIVQFHTRNGCMARIFDANGEREWHA
jgi:hypothetical protein